MFPGNKICHYIYYSIFCKVRAYYPKAVNVPLEFSLRLRPQKVQTWDLASAFSSLYEKSQQFLKGRKTKRTTLKQFDFPWKDFIIALFSDKLHGRVPKKCWSCSQKVLLCCFSKRTATTTFCVHPPSCCITALSFTGPSCPFLET